MRSQKGEFLALIEKEFPDASRGLTLRAVSEILVLARRHQDLALKDCNEGLSEREHIEYHSTIERECRDISKKFFDGKLGFVFDGDPRGITVKVIVPSGYTNDIPQQGVLVPMK